MPTFNFKDSDGQDIGNKYVTKEYLMDVYPDLVPGYASPELYTWGRNIEGQLATGNTTQRSSPGTTVGGGATWKQISGNPQSSSFEYISTGGVKTDGTLWMWGVNSFFGQLGDGTTSGRSSPVTTAGGGTNWKQVSCGNFHTAAVKTDGTLWTWGENAGYGALGDGTTTNRSSPGTTAGGGTNWKQVSCGYKITAAVKSDGTLWTWGHGGSSAGDAYGGGLGAGATFFRSSPGTTAGGGTNWKEVWVGNIVAGSTTNSVGAIKTDGTLWTWGNNSNQTLGSGSGNRSSPGTTLGGGTNWKQIAIAVDGSIGLKTDGTLWVWGNGAAGRLGTGDTSNRSSPVTTAGGGTDWKFVACGQNCKHGIKTDGTLWGWGVNNYGQIGDGTSTSKSSPVTIGGGFNGWKQVAGGYNATMGITEQGNW